MVVEGRVDAGGHAARPLATGCKGGEVANQPPHLMFPAVALGSLLHSTRCDQRFDGRGWHRSLRGPCFLRKRTTARAHTSPRRSRYCHGNTLGSQEEAGEANLSILGISCVDLELSLRGDPSPALGLKQQHAARADAKPHLG